MSAIIVYRLVQVLAFPLIVVYFLVRGLKDRHYFRHFGERLGFVHRARRFDETAHTAIWLHAVSVGEVLTAVELIRRLKARFPGSPLFLSSSTIAGRAAAVQKLGSLVDGVFYAPIDYTFAVRRSLRRIRPRVVVILETEIWPNLWREAKRIGSGLLVVNGRISNRAMPRYKRLRWFFRPVLALPDAILAQDRASFDRFLELGAPSERLRNAGNLKYDFDASGAKTPQAVIDFIERTRPEKVWIAASTMPPAEPGDPDEDDAVIEAFRILRQSHPGLALMLVPRKPERFDVAARKLEAAGVPFVRRSQLGETGDTASCLLVDTIGEMSSLFRLADVVFMGGTLAHRGGHNILEPAFFGKPVIVGPHMENFPEIARKFREAGAVAEIGGPEQLADAVNRMLDEPGDMGSRARDAAETERGATDRALAEIGRLYSGAVPAYRPSTPALAALWPLSRVWLLGAVIAQRRKGQRLATPVVSVGGMTAGGAGKTPLVLWIARRLQEAGFRPAVLTRGYRRQSGENCVIVPPGASAPATQTGDEAQVYLRAAVGPVGIGADRAAAGRRIEEQFQPDVFLLDDGFQHRALKRDFDVVVIDALDPFGGGRVIPAGRLREPVGALARADAIVVTRVRPGESVDRIEARIREYNQSAPIFAARTVPVGWIDASLTLPHGRDPVRAGAFCGLGNPDSFWTTLGDAGVAPVFREAFADHHRYTIHELETLAERARANRADVLVTTEKDAANLPEGWRGAIGAIQVLWLKIDLEIDGGQELLRVIEMRLSSSSKNLLRSSPPP